MEPLAEDTTVTDSKSSGLLKGTLSAGTIITAWVFVLGWSYLHTYYEYFGININSLQFPLYHYLAFLFAQFVTLSWEGLFLGFLIIGVFGLASAGNAARSKGSMAAVGCGFLALFWIGFRLADANAARAARDDMAVRTSTLPQLLIEFKHQPSLQSGELDEILSATDLRILLENQDCVYVFVPVALTPPNVHVKVVSIQRSEILATIRTITVPVGRP